ncbi:MAG: N-acetylmuramoyl-L-alanine amidase [Planctomycetes bacterium]|nr:N-acetylmuramoyl-L-alanine amidase [Planctomycetota bacterium]
MKLAQVIFTLVLLAAISPMIARADIHIVSNSTGSLAGKTVVVSPGHGNMSDGASPPSFGYQRGVTMNLREDIHTNEIDTIFLQRYLANAGARVFWCRERDFQPLEVIVDDGDASYAETGGWSAGASGGGHGGDYRAVATNSAETATATFAPTIATEGYYPVYVKWRSGSNRDTGALVHVHHTGGITDVNVDMTKFDALWYFVGTYYFNVGTSGKVVISNQSASSGTFVVADAVRFGGGTGVSGEPRWRESGQEWVNFAGYVNGYGDVTARPHFANFLAGSPSTFDSNWLYVSTHSNAGGGRGVSTFSYSNGRTAAWGTNGAVTYQAALQTASDNFRDVLHAEVLRYESAEYQATGGVSDRGAMIMNFGELRECVSMPSALVEILFHDTTEDVSQLKREKFRHAIARGIYVAIAKYMNPSNYTIVPMPPDHTSAKNIGNGTIRVSWAAVTDSLESSSAPTGYKIYTSTDGRGWDNGALTTTQTSIGVTGLTQGQVYYFCVCATNAGGESLRSDIVSARVSPTGAASVLIVDGFDREFSHTYDNTYRRYTHDYIRQHSRAIATAPSDTYYFDSASNEAVVAGNVTLTDYQVVDWFSGEESTADESFSTAEQSLVQAFLTAGKSLFVSGSEIAWDLGQGTATTADNTFLNTYLGANYAADSSNSWTVTGSGPFAALSGVAFDDGTLGTYKVGYPDVLTTAGGSTAVMTYGSGTQVAAVQVSGSFKVVYLGFPFETIGASADRTTLMDIVLQQIHPTISTPPAVTLSNMQFSATTLNPGDTLTITVDASGTLTSNPTLTVAGAPATFASVAGNTYSYTYAVTGAAPEVNGSNNVVATTTEPTGPQSTTSASVTINFATPPPTTTPAFTGVSATPDPANPGDTITITFQASETLVTNPQVSVSGSSASFSAFSATSMVYTYTYLVTGLSPEVVGANTISISGSNGANTGTRTGTVTFSGTASTTGVTFTNLSVSSTTAFPGDRVFITFSTSETVTANPTVTVSGQGATRVDTTAAPYVYEYTVTGASPEIDGVNTVRVEATGNTVGLGSQTAVLTIKFNNDPPPTTGGGGTGGTLATSAALPASSSGGGCGTSPEPVNLWALLPLVIVLGFLLLRRR